MSKLVGYPNTMNIIEKEIEEFNKNFCELLAMEHSAKIYDNCWVKGKVKPSCIKDFLRASLTRAMESAEKEGWNKAIDEVTTIWNGTDECSIQQKIDHALKMLKS